MSPFQCLPDKTYFPLNICDGLITWAHISEVLLKHTNCYMLLAEISSDWHLAPHEIMLYVCPSQVPHNSAGQHSASSSSTSLVISENFLCWSPRRLVLVLSAQNAASKTATQLTPFQHPQASGAGNSASYRSPPFKFTNNKWLSCSENQEKFIPQTGSQNREDSW